MTDQLLDASGKPRKGIEVLSMDGETFYCPKQVCSTIAYLENKGEKLILVSSVKTVLALMRAGF